MRHFFKNERKQSWQSSTMLTFWQSVIIKHQDNFQGTWTSFWRWLQSSYHFWSNVQVSFGLEKNRLIVRCSQQTQSDSWTVSQMAAVVAGGKAAVWAAELQWGYTAGGHRRKGLTELESKDLEGDSLKEINASNGCLSNSNSNVSKLTT